MVAKSALPICKAIAFINFTLKYKSENKDLKSIIKNCRTTINSRNLNEFVKEFDTVVVNLAKETFSSSRNVNLGHDQISKAFIKGSVPITISNKKDLPLATKP